MSDHEMAQGDVQKENTSVSTESAGHLAAEPEKRELTVGEYRVGIDFNPGGRKDVAEIKQLAANLIDRIQAIDTNGNSEVARLKAIASTDVETAAMYAVKATTKR